MLKLVSAKEMAFPSVQNYYDAFSDKTTDLNCYALIQVRNGIESYWHFLDNDDRLLFYLVNDEYPDYIIGFGSIDDSTILNYHQTYLNNGNIGYGIRPNERNKGYGTLLLRLLLEKCQDMGMFEVCISCNKENVASRKIIQSNGGNLEREFFDEVFNFYGLKYWIKLHPKLKPVTKRLVRRIAEFVNPY